MTTHNTDRNFFARLCCLVVSTRPEIADRRWEMRGAPLLRARNPVAVPDSAAQIRAERWEMGDWSWEIGVGRSEIDQRAAARLPLASALQAGANFFVPRPVVEKLSGASGKAPGRRFVEVGAHGLPVMGYVAEVRATPLLRARNPVHVPPSCEQKEGM